MIDILRTRLAMRTSPKVILITGASSGIGRGLAMAYAEPDRVLLLIGRNKNALLSLSEQLTNKGAIVKTARIDVSNQSRMAHWITEMDELFPIDLVIANAGQSMNQALISDPDPHNAELALLQTHFAGTLNTVLPCLQRMQQRRCGQIAIMSSMNAYVPLGRSCIYGAVKAGLLHYALALSKRTKEYNISVTAICPGWVKTPLTDLNSFKMPGLLSLDQGVKRIMLGISKQQSIVAFPFALKWLITLGRLFKFIRP